MWTWRSCLLRDLRNSSLLYFTLLLSSLLNGTAKIEHRTVMFQNLPFSIPYSAFWKVSVGFLPDSQLCPWCHRQVTLSRLIHNPFCRLHQGRSSERFVSLWYWVCIMVLRSCCSHAFQWPEHRRSNHRTQSAGSNGSEAQNGLGESRTWWL